MRYMVWVNDGQGMLWLWENSLQLNHAVQAASHAMLYGSSVRGVEVVAYVEG